ncbi:MAG: DUF1615 family protein [Gammaproteobacteria bacterium]|nr:DUF1615 family protein [Gammaproteobacteria bacterium]
MRYLPQKSRTTLLLALSCLMSISGCHKDTNDEDQLSERDKVARLIPERVPNRKLWATDMLAVMDEEKIPHTLNNLCSIVAIVDQESNFHANPAVPNLPQDAKKALFERIQDKLGDTGVIQFKKMLLSKPAPDDNFMMQINKLRTEQDLDVLYRKMFDYFKYHYGLALLTAPASLIAGVDIKEYLNPVKTLGSMQVHVNYAFAHPHTTSNTVAIRDEMYTQYGGLYYGISRLLGYPANYNKPIYRFADYNSGIYSSRNAAFQQIISDLSDFPLDLDGDLLIYDKEQHALADRSSTETQLDILAQENKFGLSNASIRGDLLKEKTAEFENTTTYKKINAFYLEKFKKEAPYAVMPHVEISGPKLSRDYDTNWYAKRVNGRFQRCERIGRRYSFEKSSSQNNDNNDDDSNN